MSRSGVAKQIQLLFEGGAVSGLTDGQLLERFASRRGAEAEPAFAALVARHGPMVLAVCRGMLGNPHDAEDAFQATFLVLAHKAGSLRRPDLLGPWLHGVAHHTARRLRDKDARRFRREAEAAMIRASSEIDAAGPEHAPAAREEIEALHEEIGRLPERYRVAVVLCDLQGLTHEEAARRLGRPVGTISARVARARDRLRGRLGRRGIAVPAGALAMTAVADHAVASGVPAALAASTVKAALVATGSAGLAAGAVAPSVAALARGVLGSMSLINLKTIAAACLIAGGVALGGTAAVRHLGGGSGPDTPATATAKPPAGAAITNSTTEASPLPAETATADAIVAQIEERLKTSRRALPHDEFTRVHSDIAGLADQLRKGYPDDPRVAKYLPERWISLSILQRREEARAEIQATLASTGNPSLKASARFFGFWLAYGPRDVIESSKFVAEADALSRDAPGDRRVAMALHGAGIVLDEGWYARVGVALLSAVLAGLILGASWMPRVRRPASEKIILALVVLVVIPAIFFHQVGDDSRFALIKSALGMVDQAMERFRPVLPRLLMIADVIVKRVASESWTIRGGLALVLAAVAAAAVVGYRSQRSSSPVLRARMIREASLAFLAALAVLCLLDAGRISYRRAEIRARIVRDYPDAAYALIVQGEDRQSSGVGKPFELEFDDAIGGRHVSMKDLRGKVVVVDFWATWCGPCLAEIPELKRLYAEYHDRGVEFIGISRDLPEESGGLASLKKEVAEKEIPWPQFYQPQQNGEVVRTGAARNDFAESWGITAIPTVFIVDREGRLYSANARGKLDSLIPRLLGE